MCVFFSSRSPAPPSAERDKDDLLRLLGDQRGRRFLWRLLVRAGVFRNSVTGASADVLAADVLAADVLAADVLAADVLAEGRRSLGLGVLSDILAADPTAYLAMIGENRRSDDPCDRDMSIL
jgi:hypothetical protein